MEPDQQVDWVQGAPGDEVKRKVNQSIRLHNQRDLVLRDVKEIESGRNQVRLLLIYDKN